MRVAVRDEVAAREERPQTRVAAGRGPGVVHEPDREALRLDDEWTAVNCADDDEDEADDEESFDDEDDAAFDEDDALDAEDAAFDDDGSGDDGVDAEVTAST